MTDHYFSADPAAPFEREPFTCQVWGERLDLVSGTGVYNELWSSNPAVLSFVREDGDDLMLWYGEEGIPALEPRRSGGAPTPSSAPRAAIRAGKQPNHAVGIKCVSGFQRRLAVNKADDF